MTVSTSRSVSTHQGDTMEDVTEAAPTTDSSPAAESAPKAAKRVRKSTPKPKKAVKKAAKGKKAPVKKTQKVKKTRSAAGTKAQTQIPKAWFASLKREAKTMLDENGKKAKPADVVRVAIAKLLGEKTDKNFAAV